MGLWLDLPIRVQLAFCFQHTTWSLAILSPIGRNISVLTFWSSHSGVTYRSSSKMGNILAFCNLSSYWLHCSVSFVPNSTRSLTIRWGPGLWWKDSMNKLHLCLHSYCSHSSWVSAWYMDLWGTWPFSLIIFAINVGPISLLRPRYLTSLKWSSGYGTVLSQNITHSNYSNSQNGSKLDVSSDIITLGTSPSSL